MSRDYKHLYGPVPSRRLVRSLGISTVPMKTCCFDCTYCQLGPTTNHTMERSEYVPTDAILGELEQWVAEDGRADYLTFSGAGEPTLHSQLAQMMASARGMSDIPITLLTNGALLWDPAVRGAAMSADLLMPSLDAATADTFEELNRPCAGLEMDAIIEGLTQTVREFEGEAWLEVMLVAGVNDLGRELEALAEAIETISPARVQINTVVRPAPNSDAARASDEKLMEAREILPFAEVISSAWEGEAAEGEERSLSDVMSLLSYRPCTLEDVAHGLDMHPNEALKYIARLIEDGKVRGEMRDEQAYYVKA